MRSKHFTIKCFRSAVRTVFGLVYFQHVRLSSSQGGGVSAEFSCVLLILAYVSRSIPGGGGVLVRTRFVVSRDGAIRRGFTGPASVHKDYTS